VQRAQAWGYKLLQTCVYTVACPRGGWEGSKRGSGLTGQQIHARVYAYDHNFELHRSDCEAQVCVDTRWVALALRS
jgi:hypothetical protein